MSCAIRLSLSTCLYRYSIPQVTLKLSEYRMYAVINMHNVNSAVRGGVGVRDVDSAGVWGTLCGALFEVNWLAYVERHLVWL